MTHSLIKAGGALAVATGLLLVTPGTVLADPGGEPLTLVCGEQELEVNIAPGNGDYTPALVEGTNQVLVPHAFGEFTGTVFDEAGEIVETFTEPAESKGGGKQKSNITCTYSFDDVSRGEDVDGFPEGFRFVGGGSVTGKLTHR